MNSTDYFGLYLDRHPSLPSFLCLNCLDPTTLNVSAPINYTSLRPDRPNVNDWHLTNSSAYGDVGGIGYSFNTPFGTVFNATLEGIFAPYHDVQFFYEHVIGGCTPVNITWQGEPVHAWIYNCSRAVNFDFQWKGVQNNGSESTWSIQSL